MEPNANFKPTIEWMAQKYDEMNAKLFDGQLGSCDFDFLTTGMGSKGHTYGRFSTQNDRLIVSSYTGQMFVRLGPRNNIWVDKDNFVEIFKPVIKLNGHYIGEEDAFLHVLVHEMCHYYNYMYGYCPKQAHGKEFKEIASIIANKSNGQLKITTLVEPEVMSKMRFTDEFKAKLYKNFIAMFEFRTNGEVLVLIENATNKTWIERFINKRMDKDVIKIVTSKNTNLIDMLIRKGYSKKAGWQNASREDFVKNLDSYNITTYNNPNLGENRMRNTRTIIREVIEEYLQNDKEEFIPIKAGENLGLKSPLEA